MDTQVIIAIVGMFVFLIVFTAGMLVFTGWGEKDAA